MAMTETRPETHAHPAPGNTERGAGEPVPAGGLAGLLGTGRSATIGRLWIGTSLVFLVLSGAIGAGLGAERLKPETYNIFDADNYAQSFSLHGVGALFLFAIPILIGIGIVVVPRQIGSETVAFPRAVALAFWGYLIGSGLVIVSYLINGGPFGGNDKGVDLFLASFAMVIVSLLAASVALATTVLALRAPGLSLGRVPLFTWSILTAAAIWIASLGLLCGSVVLLYVDHRYRLFAFGASTDIDKWLRWTMTQPQVFAFAAPVLGFAGDVVPVFARVRSRLHGAGLVTIGAFSALSFGAWTYLASVDNPKLTEQALFVAVSFAIALPLLVLFGAMADTFRHGRLSAASPVLFAISALLLLLAGGALRAIHPLALVGTTADSAVSHFVLGAAAVAAIGAMHHWWPQILARPLREAVGRITALLLLVGVAALAIPDVISGLLDEPRGSLYTTARDGVTLLNGISFAGGVLVLLAVGAFVVNLAVSLAA